MRILLLCLLLVFTACSTPNAGRDYTSNRSRAKSSDRSSRTHMPSARSSSSKNLSRERQGIVATAEKLLGSKYRYGGESPRSGFDCSGFTSYVMQTQGLSLPRTSGQQARSGPRKKVTQAEPGDLLFFGTGSRVTHVAIVIHREGRSLEVIHSTSTGGVRRDDVLASDYWRSRVLWAVDARSLP